MDKRVVKDMPFPVAKAKPVDAAKVPPELWESDARSTQKDILVDATPSKREYPLVDAATGRVQGMAMGSVQDIGHLITLA